MTEAQNKLLSLNHNTFAKQTDIVSVKGVKPFLSSYTSWYNDGYCGKDLNECNEIIDFEIVDKGNDTIQFNFIHLQPRKTRTEIQTYSDIKTDKEIQSINETLRTAKDRIVNRFINIDKLESDLLNGKPTLLIEGNNYDYNYNWFETPERKTSVSNFLNFIEKNPTYRLAIFHFAYCYGIEVAFRDKGDWDEFSKETHETNPEPYLFVWLATPFNGVIFKIKFDNNLDIFQCLDYIKKERDILLDKFSKV